MEWIPRAERVPPALTPVLVWQHEAALHVGWHNGVGTWYHIWPYENGKSLVPTHWMPLPEPPRHSED